MGCLRMRKHLCCALSLVLMLVLLSQGAAGASGRSMEDEVARAAQLGWDVSRTGEETVSGQDYAAMLDYFVTAVNPSKSGEWGEMFPDFRALTDSISRAEAFTALSLAAEVVGGDYLGLQRTDELFALDEQIGEPWDNYPVRWELFDEAYLEEPSSHVPEEKWTRFATGYFYAMGRYSAFSGERIFSCDSDTNSMRPEADLTYMEALLSVARLFDSAAYGRVTDRVVTQEDAALLAQADELRESIRSSESQYTVGRAEQFTMCRRMGTTATMARVRRPPGGRWTRSTVRRPPIIISENRMTAQAFRSSSGHWKTRIPAPCWSPATWCSSGGAGSGGECCAR